MHFIQFFLKLIGGKVSLAQAKTTFFKAEKGGYAEHDAFLGITVPNLRKIAKEFKNLSFEGLQVLIDSKFNEERLLALIILVDQYQTASNQDKEKIYQFYMGNFTLPLTF